MATTEGRMLAMNSSTPMTQAKMASEIVMMPTTGPSLVVLAVVLAEAEVEVEPEAVESERDRKK